MKKLFLFIAVVLCLATTLSQPNSGWVTDFEASGGLKTPRYKETIAYCKRLAHASPWIHYSSFGISPQGRNLPLVILSKDRVFEPAAAAQSGKAIVLIQSCIHAGEPDGKDASMMLMRDIAVTKTKASLLDHAIVLFVPIFNVDGHERFGSYTRINQNGPEECGWRVTAQNLNLNRDYLKADTPEMRAMLKLFAQWLPDLYVDCHVTDGIDFQYDVTYAVEYAADLDPVVASWVQRTLIPGVLPKVESAGHKIFAYVAPREDNDLSKGLAGGAASPRFSTGYAAVQNRPAFLIETHMLKPYKMRVEATYAVLEGIVETVNRSFGELRRAVATADQMTIRSGETYNPAKALPLKLKVGEKAVMKEFLGVRSETMASTISGGKRTVYTGEPLVSTIPYFEDAVVTDSVSIPLAYLIPKEWVTVIDVLRAHSIRMTALRHDLSIEVESYRLEEPQWRSRPYEGRHVAMYTVVPRTETRTFHAGTVVVPMGQRAAKVAMHLLEPAGPDALVGWGFFDAIFEQKEYAEAYVMERVGGEMLARDSLLKKEFFDRVRSDSSFAASPGERMNWLYRRSPWADPSLGVYPVGRVVDVRAMEKLGEARGRRQRQER